MPYRYSWPSPYCKVAVKSSSRAPVLTQSRVVALRWPSSSVSGSAVTADGTFTEANVRLPALFCTLKVGASGVWQE